MTSSRKQRGRTLELSCFKTIEQMQGTKLLVLQVLALQLRASVKKLSRNCQATEGQ